MNRRDLLAAASGALIAGFTPWTSVAAATPAPKLRGYLRTNWSKDPFSYGSYSHIAKGSKRKDHRKLAAPIDNKVFFAGKATNPDRNSSVHAALEAGYSVADDLLKQSSKRICIIGAGIAGLVAAHTLSKAGREVHVIEGRNRIGGRIETDRSLGFSADLGASWLHWADGNPLLDEVNKAGMRKVLSHDTYITRSLGQKIEESDLPAWLVNIMSYDNHTGTSEKNLNKWAYLFSREYSGDEFLFPDGYDQVLKNFEGDYQLSLSDKVSHVDYSGQEVRVKSSRGQNSYDAVILTVPLGVLKAQSIGFTPALPADKQSAISRLGYGVLDKLYLQFDDVFWDDEEQLIVTPFNDLPQGHHNTWMNLYPVIKKPVLVSFNGGPAALTLSSQADKPFVNDAVRTIYKAYGF
jgi:monoamine oxidase